MSLARSSRLALALTPAFVTLVVIVLAWRNASALIAARERIRHTRQVIQLTDAVLISATQAEADELASVAMHDSTLRAHEWNEVRRAQRTIDTLRALTKDNPRQGPRLDSLSQQLAARFPEPSASAATSGVAPPTGTVATFREGKRGISRMQRLLAEFTNEEDRQLTLRRGEEARGIKRSNVVLVLGGLIAVVFAVVVNLFLTNIITERERMATELGAQLGDLAKLQHELDARSSTKA